MATKYDDSFVRRITLVIFVFISFAAANVSAKIAFQSDNALMGAGAHFSWIVFDALKEDLEKATGRKTILFGEDSMVGVGCNAGIKAAKQNKPDHETFGFVCCPLSPQEIEKHQIIVYPLAQEPITIIVRQDNPVNNLSSKQVTAIFNGNVTNWNQVGGKNRPIILITRLHCKKRPGHWKSVIKDVKAFRQQRISVKSAKAMIQHINDFDDTIGHTGSTWKFKPTDKIKRLSIDGYKPTAQNIARGKYPYSRQLSAITNKSPSKDILKLIHEAQTGPAFKRVAKKYNLLPLKGKVLKLKKQ